MKMNTYVIQQDILADIVILYESKPHSKGKEAVISIDQICWIEV